MPRFKRLLFALIPAIAAGIVCALAYWLFFWKEDGQRLAQVAWDSSFKERGRPAPSWGPREGYFGGRLAAQEMHPDEKIGWREGKRNVAELVDFDKDGFQHFHSGIDKASRLVIVGASTARGTFASRIATTYFHLLGERLVEAGRPMDITVVAAGAWKSSRVRNWRR